MQHIWVNLLTAIQVLSALAMIALVLLQHGKGADMGASFGSGASGSLFGATGSANFLSRSTAICVSVFFVSTLALTFLGYSKPTVGEGGSVLDVAAPAASAAAASAPAQIPTSMPAQPIASTAAAASTPASSASR